LNHPHAMWVEAPLVHSAGHVVVARGRLADGSEERPNNSERTSPSWNEAKRLAALRQYGILDTPPEAEFEDVVRIAAHVCGACRLNVFTCSFRCLGPERTMHFQ
jgi:hypothetical protein